MFRLPVLGLLRIWGGVLAGIAVGSLTAAADDWTRFRGPDGSGVSASELPISWTPSQNVAWKNALPGPGVSSPIVVGNRVFVTCYSGYGIDRENPGKIEDLRRHLLCFAADSGEKLWQQGVSATSPEDPFTGIGVTAHGYASHTPVSDGKYVYAFLGKAGAVAFDMEGNQIWQTSLGTESDPWAWGSSSSPILHDEILIVTAAAESQAIVGLDKTTGQQLWRQEAAGLDGTWGTPTLVRIDEDRTELVLSVPKELWGMDPATGKLRWYSQATGAEQTHSSVIAGDGVVFAFTGRGGGSVAVRAGGQGEVTESNVLWSGRDSARFGSPVSYQGKIYLVAGGVITVIDEQTGEKISQARLQGGSAGGGRFGGSDYASPIVAAGKLYYQKGTGEVFVFDLADQLEQVSVNLVTTDRETFGGSPAVSDGKMFIRSNKHLYCVMATEDDVAPNASATLMAQAASGADGGPEAGRPARGGAGFGGGRGGPGGGGRGGGGRGGFDPTNLFNQRDKNSDGQLTADELTGSSMADRFESLDTDEDGGVSMDEFRAAIRASFGGGRGGAGGRRGPGGNRQDNRPKRPQRPEFAA